MKVFIYNARCVEVKSREEPDDFSIDNVADFLGMLGYVSSSTYEIDPFERNSYGGYESAEIVVLDENKEVTYYLEYDGKVPGNNPENWILEKY